MKIGFIGLGKMGSQMVMRLVNAGHEVVAYDVNQDAVQELAKQGALAATSNENLCQQLGDRPVVWLMIPQQFVAETAASLADYLPSGSIIVDGGNSDYRNTIQLGKQLAEHGIELVDVGTSGGVYGLEHGFSMMVGGSEPAVQAVDPALQSLAQKDGYGHFGPTGTGHYIKMVHNGIEYGIMQAYAEGYHVLKEGPIHDIDLGKLAGVWQHGSINESFLNGLIENMLRRDANLRGVDGYVAESGEARWTLETAAEHQIAMPVTQAAVDVRLASHDGQTSYATQFLAQLRNEFGGHDINKNTESST